MAIKKNRNKVQVIDSKLNPVESQFYSLFQTLTNSYGQGLIEPSKQLGFEDLYFLAQKTWIGNAIVNYFVRNVIQYTKVAVRDYDKGFRGVMADKDTPPTQIDFINIKNVQKFLINTGFHQDENREDSLTDYLSKITRDLIVIDQHATEIQRNVKGETVAFWAVDGGSIRRTTNSLQHDKDDRKRFLVNQEYVDKGIRYVQIVDKIPRAFFTSKDMIFGYMNKRTMIRYAGYGYSVFEQAVDIATTLTYALEYNKSQFRFDRLPRGILAVQGIDDKIAEKISAIIRGTMSGFGGKWKVPILPMSESGKDVQWINMNHNNREMEFYKFQLFLVSAFAAITGIDLAAIGFRSTDSQNIISNESGRANEAKYQQTQNVAVNAVLSHLEDHLCKIVHTITPDYDVEFSGLQVDNKTLLLDIKKKELETTRSMNELRKEDDEKPVKIMITRDLNLFDIPGIQNPQIAQMVMSYVQNQAMQSGNEEPEDESGFNESDYQNAIEDYQS